jgi:PIN domain nuclease of toxin-antitoxin system
MLNLDTHILIFALMGDLSKREDKLLRAHLWCISDIVIWELAKLAELGRITLSLNDSEVISLLSKIEVLPISVDVCRSLGKLDFSSDPADELIAATSLYHRVPLITRDKKILKSKVVPFAR